MVQILTPSLPINIVIRKWYQSSPALDRRTDTKHSCTSAGRLCMCWHERYLSQLESDSRRSHHVMRWCDPFLKLLYVDGFGLKPQRDEFHLEEMLCENVPL